MSAEGRRLVSSGSLREEPVGYSRAVRVGQQVFVADIARWEQVGRAHGEVFATVRPASTMLGVGTLIDPALLVEIEADAVVA